MTTPQPVGRASFANWTSIDLRWADNDVYGHVNNTVYYQWFDSAVNRFLIREGLLDPAQGDPIGFVVASSCDYFTPLSFPGTVEVGLAVERLGQSSVTYRLGVFGNGAIDPSAQGRFTHVYVGRESRRPVDLPSAWRTTLEKLV